MSNFSEENIDGAIVEAEPYVELEWTNSAFDRRIREFKIRNNGFKKIEEFLVSAFDIYKVELAKAVSEYNLVKTTSYFCAEFERSFHVDGDDDHDIVTEKREVHIPTKNREINSTTDLREHFRKDIINHIMQKVEDVMIEGSGFKLSKIEHLLVQIFKYEPLRVAWLRLHRIA